jgi:uncharacterized protein (DUF2267 family)
MGVKVFDKDLTKANEWFKEMMKISELDEDKGHKLLRGFMREFRDRLPPDTAVKFAAQLPVLWKGIFYEDWKISNKPIKYSKSEFVSRVHSYVANDPNIVPDEVVRRIIAFFSRKISEGEMQDIISVLPKEMKEMFI